MATADQVITAISQDLHALLVPPEQVRIDTPKLGLVVLTCEGAELLGKVAAHFGMSKMLSVPNGFFSVSYHGWRLYLDLEKADSAV